MSAREHLYQIPIRELSFDASGSAIVAMAAAASEAGAGGIRGVLDYCSLLEPHSPERRPRLLPQTDHWRASFVAVAAGSGSGTSNSSSSSGVSIYC